MGPQHPSTHGVLRLVLELDGETVISCDPVIGYLHTGIEKSCEDKAYYKVVPLTDRMDYLAPMSNNLVYCMAVEKLLELEVPPKAVWTRVLMTELTRVNSHLVWLGTHAMDLGATSVFLYCFREREMILRLYEMLSGVRMMSSYFRIGGLAADLPVGFEAEVQKVLNILPKRIDDYETLLTTNQIWLERTKGVGVLTAQDALDLGVSGPILRASGVNWDLRRNRPYCDYDKFDFEVPVLQDGDVYSRYLVRIAEMRQSVRIAQQALDGMPKGRWVADAPGYTPPDKKLLETSMEAVIYHFKYFSEGFHPPVGEVYHAIESPKGEIGCYLVSDGSPKPVRVHFRGPSFINLQALPKIVGGRLIADVVACIGSIDIVLGEVDR